MQHESLITSGSVSHTVFLFRYHTGLNKKIEQRTSKPNFVIHWQTLLEKIPTGLDHNNFLKRCTLNCVPLCQHSIQFSILKKNALSYSGKMSQHVGGTFNLFNFQSCFWFSLLVFLHLNSQKLTQNLLIEVGCVGIWSFGFWVLCHSVFNVWF